MSKQTLKILTVPHRELRKTANKVNHIDQKLHKFLTNLGNTLALKENPRGVGLAAPQVGKQWRVFSTFLPEPGEKNSPPIIKLYINPVIVKHCKRKKVLGEDPKNPTLEGCLSIPKFYGSVPRPRWVEIEYQQLEGDKLVNKKKRFSGFYGRVVQHEIDHLNGVLFTDYSLEYDLPIYQENPLTGKLEELEDRSIVEVF